MSDDPRFPLGEHDPTNVPDDRQLSVDIDSIAELPDALRRAVHGLDDDQLDTPYRDGGWTVRQVVHHLADSHVNSFARFRLTLTEDKPTIRTYDEKAWAELPDARRGSLEPSLQLLDGLHLRWAVLLRGLGPAELDRPLFHPEVGDMTLRQLVGLYGWHCRHHVAHITELRRRRGW